MRDASDCRIPTGSTMRTKPRVSPRHKLSHTLRMLETVKAPTAPTPPDFTQPPPASASRPWSRHELALSAVKAWQRQAHVEGQQLARATMHGLHGHLQAVSARSDQASAIWALPACTASSVLARSAERILLPHLSRRAHALAALLDDASSQPQMQALLATSHDAARKIAALIDAIEADHGWLSRLRAGCRNSWQGEPTSHDADTPRIPPLHDAILATQLWLSRQIESLLWHDAAQLHAALVTIANRRSPSRVPMPAEPPGLLIAQALTATERQGELQ